MIRAIALAVLLLNALSTPAYADTTWVLWKTEGNVYGTVDGGEEGHPATPWHPIRTTDNKGGCLAILATAKKQLIEERYVVTSPGFGQLQAVEASKDPARLYLKLACWPVGVNPR
jgi:hypothetical protein